ncbi:MAG TPA: ABC transporter permease [Vicinamibacterales bacterium]|nr:ABC transporter permease [Vicinamibacterales bacterium]
MTHSFDLRAEVRRHVAKSGIQLPEATVDELVAYLEDLYAAAVDDGATQHDARARALAALEESAFSVLQRHAAKHPDRIQAARADLIARAAGGRSLNVMSAIRLAVRQFRQHPTFAIVTVLVLGLGTGAATTVFTVVDSVVLRPLPYSDPDRLVTLWDTNTEKGLAHDPISPVNFMDYRVLPVFSDAAGWWRPGVNLTEPGMEPMRVNTIETGANLFEVLGVKPQVGAGFPAGGKMFVPNELICVISDRLWRNRFSGDPSIIGKPISLNDTPYVVVGVMAPKFQFPDDVDVWQRVRWDFTQHSRAAHFMEAVARLSPGTTFAQAQSAVDALGTRLAQENPGTNKGWNARLVSLLDEELGYYRPALMVLFGAVALLLIIGVLNVATLLLTRALSREKEIAVRVALGAAPRQLVTQLMAESLVLSVAGAITGIAATAAALPLIVSFTPVQIPRLEEAGIDVRALGLCLAVVAVTTIVFGLVPALLLLRTQFTTDLKAGERGSSKGARRIYSVLVAAEVAMACALLVSSALLVRTVGRMMDTPTGVRADDVTISTVQVSPSAAGAPARGGTLETTWVPVANVHSRILDEIRAQPGVTAAGAANFLPFTVGWRNPFLIEGQPRPARQEDLPQAQIQSVSEGYFEAMGATIVRGRAFSAFDHKDAAGAVIVNETFAKRYLPDIDPVGQVIRTWATGIGPLGANLKSPPSYRPPPEGLPAQIVGLVKDVNNVPLGQTVEPAIYFTTRQFPFSEVFIAVNATDPGVAQTAIRNALRKVVPNVPMSTTQTWGERFAAKTAEARLLMTILLFFGGLAAVLAALGVYGLFSWSVALRTRELAIRLTLGAKPSSVGALVIGQSAVLVIAGLAVGLVIVRLAESALTRVVYGVTTTDALALATASALLLLAAIIACVPPAIRAMRVNPVDGLRAE